MVFSPSYMAARIACCQAAGAAKPDPGVEAAGIIPLPGYVHTATGDGPVWIEVTYDDAGVRTETYFYRDNNGVTHMTTSNSVGRNDPAPAKQQFVGTFGADWANVSGTAPSGFSAGDLLDMAIAGTAKVRLPDGTSRLVDKTKDFIASIDIDLKPVGADYVMNGTPGVTTSAQAQHIRGGGIYDIDAGGSSSAGEIRSPDGFYLPIYDNTDIVTAGILPGSAVVVSVTIASTPE